MEGRVRMARGAGAAGASTLLALGFHVAGGGTVPGLLGLLVPLVLSCVGASAMMSGRPRLLATMAAASLAQILFHVSFSLGAASVGASDIVPAGAGAHHHGGADAGEALTAVIGAGHLSRGAAASGAGDHTLLHGDARMWSMHLVAAIATALVLHRGEVLVRWLAVFARAVVAAITPSSPRPVPLAERPRSVFRAPVDVIRSLLLTRLTPGRAPPVGPAA